MSVIIILEVHKNNKKERTSEMEKLLTMSIKEIERLKVIQRKEAGEITVNDMAEILQISQRQTYRILARYRQEGSDGLIHRLRGKGSNRGYSKDIQKQVVLLYKERYWDYEPTLFSERLLENHQLDISRQTLSRWLWKEGVWTGKRKKRPHRKKRERREAIGSLIQFDGSHHCWFEERGKSCCLLVAIDDASGKVMLRFAKEEDTESVLEFWMLYIQRYGIPQEIYTDGGSVYFDPRNPKRLTQFGRSLDALNIGHIHAYSPQAKGRVERSNRTHQDRLLKALRENNISTIEEANRFLDEVYCNSHNNRFAQIEGLSDIHRPADDIDLKNIFCWEETRKVYNDYTITLNSSFIQLLRSETPLPPPGSTVLVKQWLDGSLHLFWRQQELTYSICKTRPKNKKKINIPAKNHPWRIKFVGRKQSVLLKRKKLELSEKGSYDKASVECAENKSRKRKDSVRYAHSVFSLSSASP
jgi:transposase